MPRTIQVTVPAERTDRVLEILQHQPGVISLRIQRGSSLIPPGDVLTFESTSAALHELMSAFRRENIGCVAGTSIVTSEPLVVISPAYGRAVAEDATEATWEEMETTIGKESNMTANGILMMNLSGMLGAFGLASNSLHVVLAAMLIAPGFEPIARISLGVIARGRGWRRGLSDTALAYLALALGAAAGALFIRLLGKDPMPGEASYLPQGVLVGYWGSFSAVSLLITIASSAAGAVLIAAKRTVLTAGVMVGLALVPSAVIAGMAVVLGDWDLATRGLVRWTLEVVAVLVLSALVFSWKRIRIQRRDIIF